MSIDLKTIKHISKLSRISVDDKKAEKLAGDLNSIFDFIEKLSELKTDNIQPLTSVAETTLKLRPDEIKSKNIREQILKNSPADVAGMKRGDIFHKINGTQITTKNYNDLLKGDYYKLNFGTYSSKNYYQELPSIAEIVAIELKEDPIFHYSVIK